MLACLCLALFAMPVLAETVVIANACNAKISLTLEQLEKIYLGKVTRLSNGNMVQPLDQPDGPQREAFYQAVMGKDSTQIDLYWSQQLFTGQGQPPITATSAEDVVKLVAKNPNLIGYVDKALVHGDRVIVLLQLGENDEEESIAVYK
jgi:ABC-type phosphate transport system, periplasmic component